MRQALEIEGYEVLLAEHGKAAQDILPRLSPPCVILLDLMMPVMDGWEFLNWKNTKPEFDSIPVVIMSAVAGTPKTSGTVGFLKKPVNLDKMLDLLESHCR